MHDLLAAGLHPVTEAKLRILGIPAVLIGQVIGDAPLSAGYHAVDGQFRRSDFPELTFPDDTGVWVNYCGAVDLRPARFDLSGTEQPMTREAVYTLVSAASLLGLCMFFRFPLLDGTPGSWPEHIHCVDAGVKLKAALSEQVHSFRMGLNGLVGEQPMTFFKCSQFAASIIHSQWLIANGGVQQ